MKSKKNSGIFIRLYHYYPLIFALTTLLLLCVGYNYSTPLGIFPDEGAHLGFVMDVVRQGLPDYSHGLIWNSLKLNYLEHPALYYVFTGEFAKLFLHYHDFSLKFLRFTNYFFSALTIYFCWLALLKLKISKNACLFAFIPLLSIPMFIMLSSSVNNDPLMILGCTLAFYAFVTFYNDPSQLSKFILLLLAGCVITALTKATGALNIICVIFSFIIFDFKKVKYILKNLSGRLWFSIFIALAIVAVYYLSIWYRFGHFYPSPQENPAFWYQKTVPDAPRMGIMQHLIAFYHFNMYTLLDPYGHQNFVDTIWREKLEFTVIAALPLCWVISLFSLYKRNRNVFRLMVVYTIAFILFMFFYFIKIRSLHLETGYPGAMQSRYFYGFLPFFIMVYALSFDRIKNLFIKISGGLLLIATMLFSFYPSWAPQFSPWYGQETFNMTYGELTPDRLFEQTFVARSKEVNTIALKIGTYQRKNVGSLSLSLYDSASKLIASNVVDAASIADNSWVQFHFKNIALQPGAGYILRLTSSNTQPGRTVTWWALGAFKEYEQYAGTAEGPGETNGNRYTNGINAVDGKPMKGVFTFRIYRH